MLEIKVLGTGCAACVKLEQLVLDVLQSLGVRTANVELVTGRRAIEYGLLGDQVPGLLINRRLVWAGSLPEREQVAAWIQQALAVPAEG